MNDRDRDRKPRRSLGALGVEKFMGVLVDRDRFWGRHVTIDLTDDAATLDHCVAVERRRTTPEWAPELTVGHQVTRPEWHERAACRGASPHLMVDGNVGAAKRLCSQCPVIIDCYEKAMAAPELSGVWGGTTHRERNRRRAQTARRSAT